MIKTLALISSILLAASHSSRLDYKVAYDDSICGIMSRSAGLVIGGRHSTRTQFPWMAVVAVQNSKHWVHQGSGSLITSRHVLVYIGTVAYPDGPKLLKVITPDRVNVFLGVTNRNDLKRPGWLRIGVSKIVAHPDARTLLKSLTINKVAIVTLEREVAFSEFIRPVCLWPFGSSLSDIVGSDAYAVGYGRDDNGKKTLTRKQVHVTVIDERKCEATYGKDLQVANGTALFCTIGNGNEGPCIYDDQLYMKVDSHWYLKGILTTSYVFSDGSCVVDKPSLYEDIYPMMSWILEQIK